MKSQELPIPEGMEPCPFCGDTDLQLTANYHTVKGKDMAAVVMRCSNLECCSGPTKFMTLEADPVTDSLAITVLTKMVVNRFRRS